MSTELERPEDGRTPTLEELIQIAIESYLVNMNTSMPGKIVSYDKDTQKAEVQPLFVMTFSGDVKLDIPIISNVPVVFPRTKDAYIHFPIAKDDPCLLVFNQRSLDTWKASDGIVTVDPDDDRKFDFTDCVAFPGLSSDSAAFTPENNTDVIMVNKDGKMCISPEGKFAMSNGTVELFSLMIDLWDEMIAAKVTTGIGPQPFFASTITKFEALKAKFEELKK